MSPTGPRYPARPEGSSAASTDRSPANHRLPLRPPSSAATPGVAHDPGNANKPGDDLFSRKAALSVSSALESLTAVFGMGTGVASPLESPGFFCCEDVTRQR